MEGFALSSKPWLFPCKRFMWPPCGIVLTGFVLSCRPGIFSHLIVFNIFLIIMAVGFFFTQKLDWDSPIGWSAGEYCFLCSDWLKCQGILFVTFWLVEMLRWLTAQNPVLYSSLAVLWCVQVVTQTTLACSLRSLEVCLWLTVSLPRISPPSQKPSASHSAQTILVLRWMCLWVEWGGFFFLWCWIYFWGIRYVIGAGERGGTLYQTR